MTRDVVTKKDVLTRDGRTLAYAAVGDPDGPLVIHNHGGPSSRLEAHLFAEAASKHKLRLICVDRPGIGQSSPQAHRTYAGWADDMTAIGRDVESVVLARAVKFHTEHRVLLNGNRTVVFR